MAYGETFEQDCFPGKQALWSHEQTPHGLDLPRSLERVFQDLDFQSGQFRRSEINPCELRPELKAGERDGDLDNMCAILGMRQCLPDQRLNADLHNAEETIEFGHEIAIPRRQGEAVRASGVEGIQLLDQPHEAIAASLGVGEHRSNSVGSRGTHFVPHIHAAGPHNVTERGKCRETVAGPTPARSAISAKVVGTTPFSSWSRIVASTIRLS